MSNIVYNCLNPKYNDWKLPIDSPSEKKSWLNTKTQKNTILVDSHIFHIYFTHLQCCSRYDKFRHPIHHGFFRTVIPGPSWSLSGSHQQIRFLEEVVRFHHALLQRQNGGRTQTSMLGTSPVMGVKM